MTSVEGARGPSAVRAYQDLVVGSRSWLALLRYELVASWGAVLPGAAGLAFRSRFWPGLFGRSGRKTRWGRNISLWHPGSMWIGEGVVVDEGCYLDAKGCAPGEFRLEDGAFISRNCIVSGKDGPLRIGAGANIGSGCTLYASTRLEVGDNVLLAAGCYVGGGRYTSRGRMDLPIARQPEPRKGVVIGENSWLGAGAVIIDGVRVGPGSVVAAGAVVVRDVEPFSVVAGVPARRIAWRGGPHTEGGSL